MSEAGLRIEIKILDPRLPGWGFPSRGSRLSAGIDLHAAIDAPFSLDPQGSPVLVPAGIALNIAFSDWCALVLPRSGLGHQGLVLGNGVGLIDADYQGQLLISAWNRNRDRPIIIRPGDRIAQLVFVRIAQPQFAFVEDFSDRAERGHGGFGSTGVSAAWPKSGGRGNSQD